MRMLSNATDAWVRKALAKEQKRSSIGVWSLCIKHYAGKQCTAMAYSSHTPPTLLSCNLRKSTAEPMPRTGISSFLDALARRQLSDAA